ncbi:hypothetical protein B566_EDAN002410 [Ephemera danica]|nr:hypothetical protein B566_EDAN002410 [Ephemera danica]
MLKEVPLIDGHNDLAWNIRNFIHNRLAQFNFSADLRQVPPWSLSSWSQTDLPRLQRGLLGGQFWSAYVPCEAQHRDAVQLTLEQVNVIRRLVASYPTQLGLATSADEIEREHSAGRVASLIGVEGGHSIGNSLGVLRAMYDLGTMVHEMNRLGMIVDLSHASGRTVRATLKATRSPIIFSHSGARALCNSTRNVPDSVLHALVSLFSYYYLKFYNILKLVILK